MGTHKTQVQPEEKRSNFTAFGMAYHIDPASELNWFVADVHRFIREPHAFVHQHATFLGNKLHAVATRHVAPPHP